MRVTRRIGMCAATSSRFKSRRTVAARGLAAGLKPGCAANCTVAWGVIEMTRRRRGGGEVVQRGDTGERRHRQAADREAEDQGGGTARHLKTEPWRAQGCPRAERWFDAEGAPL